MEQKDVVVHEEEEDFGIALQKLEIPLALLERNSIVSVNSLTDDDISAFIEDPNLLPDDSRDHIINKNSSNSQTVTIERSLGPKLRRNKRSGRKRRPFKNVPRLFDSEVRKPCFHCGIKDTPLWREGPRGAGTLCNACGLRYRTGRLLPEYRPASSPGFKPNVHSNFHRRVMQIRSERDSPHNDLVLEGSQQ